MIWWIGLKSFRRNKNIFIYLEEPFLCLAKTLWLQSDTKIWILVLWNHLLVFHFFGCLASLATFPYCLKLNPSVRHIGYCYCFFFNHHKYRYLFIKIRWKWSGVQTCYHKNDWYVIFRSAKNRPLIGIHFDWKLTVRIKCITIKALAPVAEIFEQNYYIN